MAVQVHGVGGGECVLDDYADGGVVAEVVGVPLRVEGVGDVALVCEDEHRVAGEMVVSYVIVVLRLGGDGSEAYS